MRQAGGGCSHFTGDSGPHSPPLGCVTIDVSSMTFAAELRALGLPRPKPPPTLLPGLLLLPCAAVPPPLRRRLARGISCISFCMHRYSPSSEVAARLDPCSAHLQVWEGAGAAGRGACGQQGQSSSGQRIQGLANRAT